MIIIILFILMILRHGYFQACRRPLGPFLSFDARRSLFSGKRLADEMSPNVTPASKRLRDTESAFSNLRLTVRKTR